MMLMMLMMLMMVLEPIDWFYFLMKQFTISFKGSRSLFLLLDQFSSSTFSYSKSSRR